MFIRIGERLINLSHLVMVDLKSIQTRHNSYFSSIEWARYLKQLSEKEARDREPQPAVMLVLPSIEGSEVGSSSSTRLFFTGEEADALRDYFSRKGLDISERYRARKKGERLRRKEWRAGDEVFTDGGPGTVKEVLASGKDVDDEYPPQDPRYLVDLGEDGQQVFHGSQLAINDC